jgi:hypothetical protein
LEIAGGIEVRGIMAEFDFPLSSLVLQPKLESLFESSRKDLKSFHVSCEKFPGRNVTGFHTFTS